MLKFFIIFLFIIIPSVSNAATHAAESASRADVAAAISAATYGDTVTIPACAIGDCVWDTGIDVTKNIIIQGAGINDTCLTSNFSSTSGGYDGFFKFTPDATARANIDSYDDTGIFQVTGIHFYRASMRSYTYAIWVINNSGTTPIKRVRVNGNKFTYMDRGIWAQGYVHALFDSNTLINSGGGSADGAGTGSGHWIYDLRSVGSATALYIEDNTFTFNVTQAQNRVLADNNHGVSAVVRYNTVNGASSFNWETHPPGSQFTEIYGNNFDTAGGQSPQLRSGVGLIYFNREQANYVLRREYSDVVTWAAYSNEPPQASTCPYPTAYNPYTGTSPQICNDSLDAGGDCFCSKVNHTYLWNNRKTNGDTLTAVVTTDAWNTDESKDNTGEGNITKPELVENREYFNYNASFNGTTGTGCGTLASRPATCTIGVGYWATDQSCSDLTDYIGASPTTTISGTLYRCTSTNTWTAYYTPYTYPHPLRNEAPTTYALTVTPSGSGTGTVTSSPGGVDCGSTCNPSFNTGQSVILTATATSPNYFVGWSGEGCSGTSTCEVTMSAAKSVTATFSRYGTATIGAGGSMTIGSGGSLTLQ